jgi:hypothetical protein
MWTCHVKNSSGFLLIYMGFYNKLMEHRHGKLALFFGDSFFYTQNHKNKVMLILRIERKNLYISTCQVEICSDFIKITNQFH